MRIITPKDIRINKSLEKVFLLTTAGILFLVSLSYGLIPEHSFSILYGLDISVTDFSITHMLRTLMWLYLWMLGFWIVWALNKKYTISALYSLVVFMFSVAFWRVFSIIFDGVPHFVFIFFLFSELMLWILWLYFIRKHK